MRTVIVAGRAHEIFKKTLESKGYQVIGGPAADYAFTSEHIVSAEGLVIASQTPADKALIDKASNLKWIGRLGSGMELIDVEYATQKGIVCVSSPEGNRNAVAEHCMGLVLNLMNNISSSFEEVKQFVWKRNENRGFEIYGKTVGVIGYGNTGSRFAQLISGFGATVLAYDKYKYGFGGEAIKEASLEQIAKYADIISFHVPLTKETFHMANDEFFQSLERKPYFLNASRGKVADISAVLRALETGKIAAAGLDVLENEKLETYTAAEKHLVASLCSHPNVIITPHIAGYTFEALYKMATILIEKLEKEGCIL